MKEQQFIQHMESNQKAVRRFLTALCCGDAEMADDLAQDTFIKAYLSCANFREESRFSTWIYRIAYNTFLNSRRSLTLSAPLADATEMPGTDKPDHAFEYQDLYMALEKLSGKERMAILLHYMQGYSVSEIADITETNSDAVRKQLARGRQHLKGLLTE